MFLKDSDIIELHGEGAGDLEISEILGCSHSAVRYRRIKLGLPRNPLRVRFKKMYVVYDRKTGEFIAQGIISELSAFLGIHEDTLRKYCTMTKKKTGRQPKVFVYEVEQD